MRIYVAGRTKNVKEVNLIQNYLLDHGHQITHDWTDVKGDGKGEIRDDWSGDPQRARQVATLDFLGVAQADGVILCGYGCDEETKGGLGTFVEAGIALASGIPIIVLGPMRESVFWYSPFTLKVDYRKDDIDELLPVKMKHGAVIHRTDEDIIQLETTVAINGLESLDRQRRLALSDTDVTSKID